MTVETVIFQDFDANQSRELVNTRQRFETFLAAQERLNGYRGAMVDAVRAVRVVIRPGRAPWRGCVNDARLSMTAARAVRCGNNPQL